MKRSDFSIELKDWVPGVYSTLESQLQLIAECFDVESSSRLSYFEVIRDFLSLGVFDNLAVRNLAIMLRVYILKIANSPVKLQELYILLQRRILICMKALRFGWIGNEKYLNI